MSTNMDEAITSSIHGISENRLKRTLFVGGLHEKLVDKDVLQRAFEVFGDIKTIELPINKATETHRGFGFVEFKDIGDAKEAISNMDGAELMDRVLTVNLARNLSHDNQTSHVTKRPPWIAEYLKRKRQHEQANIG